MKKLFLASSKLNTLEQVLDKNPSDLSLIFIPTAADPYDDKWFVEKDRKQLKAMGFKFQELDLKDKTPQSLKKGLGGADIIYIAGGNTFYLLLQCRKSGFDKLIKKLVNNGVIYAGSSAGAIIAGPTIEPVKEIDNPQEASELKDFTGFNLVDFVVLPHYDKLKNEKQYKKIVKEASNLNLKIKILTDEQAILVQDGKAKLVGEGKEIKLS